MYALAGHASRKSRLGFQSSGLPTISDASHLMTKEVLPCLDVSHVLDQTVEVKSLRCIEIILVPESCRQLVQRQSLVVAVHGQDDYPWQIELLDDGMSQRSLAGAGRTRHTDKGRVCPWWRVVCPVNAFLVADSLSIWYGAHRGVDAQPGRVVLKYCYRRRMSSPAADTANLHMIWSSPAKMRWFIEKSVESECQRDVKALPVSYRLGEDNAKAALCSTSGNLTANFNGDISCSLVSHLFCSLIRA